ncbi:transposable element Tcb2 transposase [Trichonephila clavipes]|nr:transposable element Tcb2 transposase [Trichonephila clavipes]
MTAQRYVHDILQPHVLPLTTAPTGLFQQDNAQPHTVRVSQDFPLALTTLSWPARSPDLSPIENIWNHLGQRVGHPTNLNELETRYIRRIKRTSFLRSTCALFLCLEKAHINVALFSYTKAFGDGPRNFESCSSDVADT